MNLMSRHRLGRPGGRDMGLTSRPGLLNLGSRHHFKVVTWLVQLGKETMRDIPWCRDLGWPV